MRLDGGPPRQLEDVDMEEPHEGEPRTKKTRTVGALTVEAFVEANDLMYEGLDQQDAEHARPEETECYVGAILEDDTRELVPEEIVYDAKTGQPLPLDLVRQGREREIREMEKLSLIHI